MKQKAEIINPNSVDRSDLKITRRSDGSIDVECVNDQPSMTDQTKAVDTDINRIVALYMKTGELPSPKTRGQFADLVGLPTDLLQAHSIILDSQKAFESLDADVRFKFRNDPIELIRFLQDSSNKDEAIKLGLIPAPEVVKPDLHLQELQNINKNLSKKPKNNDD